jgi:adenylosuccinate synthase
MEILAVVGANYGDEGKGLVTDYLSREHSLVVRYNGGAQAGHTVVTPSGRRHVFHHIGSGTFRGADTFLSKYFIINPTVFAKECKELKDVVLNAQDYEPLQFDVFVDNAAPVTTPFDMMLNQAIEAKRGNSRHGSCGFGINETVVRHASEFPISALDLCVTKTLRYTLEAIQDRYVPRRAEQLGLTEDDLKRFPFRESWVIDDYLKDVEFFCKSTRLNDWTWVSNQYEHIVFEGAQGLRLDRDSTDFPYVTNSKTGISNILDMLLEVGIKEPLKVHYVTRSYTTRHGAGPLLHELQTPYKGIKDETNIPNPFQGTLRFGILDYQRLERSIRKDSARHLNVWPKLVITCMDQIPDPDRLHVITWGEMLEMSKEHLRDILCPSTVRDILFSYGPTRDTITK